MIWIEKSLLQISPIRCLVDCELVELSMSFIQGSSVAVSPVEYLYRTNAPFRRRVGDARALL